jgi:hypothetical protein
MNTLRNPQARLALLLMAALLASCATPYEKAGFFGGGYKDLRIDSNTASVSFTGNASTSRQTVETYLLYRCAEVTKDAGYDYFVLLNPTTERTVSVGPGTYQQNTIISGTRSGGFATTTGTYNPGFTSTQYGADDVIKMFKGSKPEGNPFAFDAREVLQHLGPEVVGRDSP